MNATVTCAPLPVNFRGTPQQLLEAILDRLEVTVDGTSFVISDVAPAGNQGPWLRNGKQWWVWDEGTSTYIPLDISASITQQIYVGDINNAPDPTKYQIWLQLNGSAVNGLYYYAGPTVGWTTKSAELKAGIVTLDLLAQQPAASLITFDTNKNPILLPPGQPGQYLISQGSTLAFTAPPTVPTIKQSGQLTWAVGGVTPFAHGLTAAPAYIRCVAVCIVADGGYNIGDEIQLPGASQDGGWNEDLTPQIHADATNIYFSNGRGVAVFQKNGTVTSGIHDIQPANWKIKYYYATF